MLGETNPPSPRDAILKASLARCVANLVETVLYYGILWYACDPVLYYGMPVIQYSVPMDAFNLLTALGVPKNQSPHQVAKALALAALHQSSPVQAKPAEPAPHRTKPVSPARVVRHPKAGPSPKWLDA